MMALSIRLAEKGQFTTSPNPNVGCVLVDEKGNIVGQGWHHKAGSPHAEVHALREAGDKAKGATAYVSLEPCNHQGKTPPCTQALIQAGVKRVVAAMVDPNPLVAGKGLKALANAGIDVSDGLLQSDAEKVNRGFIKRMRIGRPFVTVKLASTIDGKTALQNGKSKWITGPEARRDVQRHRAKACAILSGSGTVLADDPSLNVRGEELTDIAQQFAIQQWRQPAKVILDGRNQLHENLHLFNLPGKVLLINREHNACPFPEQVNQWQAPAKGNKLDLNAVMVHLASMQFNHIWVEAGSRLAGALLKENVIDELILYQAPKLIGHEGQGLFATDPLQSMDDVVKLNFDDVRQIGADLKITASIQHK